MKKVELEILGLSASPASNNAYALILKEVDGNRRLPIIIGAFEAQAIALELEGVTPLRPMTHDLFKTFIGNVNGSLTEVFINDLQEGTFFAKLSFDSLGVDLDARPSDAIAMAVRFNSPIFISSEILNENALSSQTEDEDNLGGFPSDRESSIGEEEYESNPQKKEPTSKIDKLKNDLDKAIEDENYEVAAKLRDEIQQYLESS